MDCSAPGNRLDDMLLKKNYWRADAKSKSIYLCKLEGACPAGARHGEAVCEEGFEGAACGSCEFSDDVRYYLAGVGTTCEKCNPGAAGLVYAVGATLGLALLGAGGAASYYADRSMVTVRATRTYRVISPSRIKILWTLFQIITSIEAMLAMSFPPPFSNVLDALAWLQLDILHLPVACIAEFNFAQKLFFATLTPIALVLLCALTYFARAHFTSGEEGRRKVFAVHVKLALLVAWCAYPTTAATIFEMLRPCDEFERAPNAAPLRFLGADPSLECGTAEHSGLVAYAVLMLLLITVGVPCTFGALLWRNRARIDPPCKDEMTKQRVRSQDRSVAHISFLYKDFKSSCMFMEPIELVRRMFLVGAVGFCGQTAETQSAVGAFVALLSIFLYRELEPYSDRLTNLLANVAMWMGFITFLSAFIIETRPFGYEDNVLGGVLFAFFGLVISVAVHCATRDFAEQAEAKQRQCELEFRECEADMDIAELRADILQLREKYEPHELERERRANRVEDLAGRAALAKQANTALVDPTAKTNISFYKAQYPCYVLSLERLREHERLPVHEDALKAGRLDILTQTSTMPSSAFTYFVSQNWETFGDAAHPDNVRNTKANWLKNLPRHMKLPSTVSEVWVWWDLVCIPQRARVEQKKAIDSLCCYAQLCSRFLPLVRDADAWQVLYHEDLSHPHYPTAGTLETYASRGWCRLEILAGLAPKKFQMGGWRPGPRNVRFRYHHNPDEPGVGPLLTAELLRNPMDGNFTVEADRDAVLPVTQLIAERFAEYAASGADTWDATLDVHGRPKWLKDLAGVAHELAESPAVNPLLTEAAALQRPFRPGAPAAVIVDGIAVAVGVQQKPLLLSTTPVSMIVLEPTEVRQQVISKPVATGGRATAMYKVTPFDDGAAGDDAKDEDERRQTIRPSGHAL